MIRLALVDDHEIVREGLRSILQVDDDFEIVAEFGRAEDLLDVLEEVRPDVILLDARLPGLSGAEACQALVEASPQTPILMVSTYSDDALVDECIQAGAKGYLVKDIERFSLREGIRAINSGGAAMSPVIATKVLDRLRRGAEPDAGVDSIGLSDAQMRILRLIGAGFSNREIATQIRLSENTIKSHVQEIFRKLQVGNRVQAAVLASRRGWL